MSFKRDKAIADQFNAGEVGYTPDLMCRAQGCPNRWSIDAEGRNKLCSAHAWSDPHLWPRITQEQMDAVSNLAVRQKPEPRRGSLDICAAGNVAVGCAH